MRKMEFWNEVKGGLNNLRLMLDLWAKPSIKDGLKSVDKRMDRQQSILKRYSAQNYLVQFKVQSVVIIKYHSARLQVKKSHVE